MQSALLLLSGKEGKIPTVKELQKVGFRISAAMAGGEEEGVEPGNEEGKKAERNPPPATLSGREARENSSCYNMSS